MFSGLGPIIAVAGIIGIAVNGGDAAATGSSSRCKAFPGDSKWPSKSTWDSFNSTVGGRLIANVPIGSPCHDPNYDEAKCNALRAGWTDPNTHIASSSSFMQTYLTDRSCDPWTDRKTPCKLGNYATYSVNIRDASDAAKTVKFAKDKNIRLVIKNSGHDYFGRSTGAGSLAIWTQSLKSIKWGTWSDKFYTGPSVTLGAGVLGYEILEAANTRGVTVLTGECPTVGLAGGFTQGGGHSALSPALGMAADQTLEFEVVTAAGSVVKASATKNSDLYWALSGGGGGNYGIVISMTVRVHPGVKFGSSGVIVPTEAVTTEQFNQAIAITTKHMSKMTDQGAMVITAIRPEYLAISPIALWNSTGEYIRDVIAAPLVKELQDSGIFTIEQDYVTVGARDLHDLFLGPLPIGALPVANHQQGGRLVPKSVIKNNPAGLAKSLSKVHADGAFVLMSAGQFDRKFSGADNAVLPEWRSAGAQVSLLAEFDPSASWDILKASEAVVTNKFMPEIKALTPGAKAYMNEADYNEEAWQEQFYGSNYGKLLSIKNKWDPSGLFYVYKGVGSASWKVDATGRLCAC